MNGRFYRVSEAQVETNFAAVAAGFDLHRIAITVEDPHVSASDTHLNDRANAQLMCELAQRVRSRLLAP